MLVKPLKIWGIVVVEYFHLRLPLMSGLTLELSGGEAVRLNEWLGRKAAEFAASNACNMLHQRQRQVLRELTKGVLKL